MHQVFSNNLVWCKVVTKIIFRMQTELSKIPNIVMHTHLQFKIEKIGK